MDDTVLADMVWGAFMFSVRFRRVRVRRPKNFSLSRQNRLS